MKGPPGYVLTYEVNTAARTILARDAHGFEYAIGPLPAPGGGISRVSLFPVLSVQAGSAASSGGIGSPAPAQATIGVPGGALSWRDVVKELGEVARIAGISPDHVRIEFDGRTATIGVLLHTLYTDEDLGLLTRAVVNWGDAGLVPASVGLFTGYDPQFPKRGDKVKRVYSNTVVHAVVDDVTATGIHCTVLSENGGSMTQIGSKRAWDFDMWKPADGPLGLWPEDEKVTACSPPRVNAPYPPCNYDACATCKTPFEFGPMPGNRPDAGRDCGQCRAMNRVFK